jgi:hypothetical protein
VLTVDVEPVMAKRGAKKENRKNKVVADQGGDIIFVSELYFLVDLSVESPHEKHLAWNKFPD